MARSAWKLVYFTRYTLKQVFKIRKIRKVKKTSASKNFFIFNKSTVILKSFLRHTVTIYKGNLFRKLYISKYLIGFKFGEFTHTRKPFTYPIKKKKNKLRR